MFSERLRFTGNFLLFFIFLILFIGSGDKHKCRPLFSVFISDRKSWRWCFGLCPLPADGRYASVLYSSFFLYVACYPFITGKIYASVLYSSLILYDRLSFHQKEEDNMLLHCVPLFVWQVTPWSPTVCRVCESCSASWSHWPIPSIATTQTWWSTWGWVCWLLPWRRGQTTSAATTRCCTSWRMSCAAASPWWDCSGYNNNNNNNEL